MESSFCEKPERHTPRRLSDYLMLEGQKQKVHSLVDKVYARKNLQLAWERVRANRGASGTDRITIEEFEANLDANLERLHRELRDDTYQPHSLCDGWRSRKEEPLARPDHWVYRRFMIECANKRWPIAWSRFLRRSLMRAVLGIGRVERQPMR
jgi:hypothetical protein